MADLESLVEMDATIFHLEYSGRCLPAVTDGVQPIEVNLALRTNLLSSMTDSTNAGLDR